MTKIHCWCGDNIDTDDTAELDTFMKFHEVICPEHEPTEGGERRG